MTKISDRVIVGKINLFTRKLVITKKAITNIHSAVINCAPAAINRTHGQLHSRLAHNRSMLPAYLACYNFMDLFHTRER